MKNSLCVHVLLGPWHVLNRSIAEQLRQRHPSNFVLQAGTSTPAEALSEIDALFGLELLRSVATAIDGDALLPLLRPATPEQSARCAALVTQIEHSDTLIVRGGDAPTVRRLLAMLAPEAAIVTPDTLDCKGFDVSTTPYASRCHQTLRVVARLPPLRAEAEMSVISDSVRCFRARCTLVAPALLGWASTVLRSFGTVSIEGRAYVWDQRGFGNVEIVATGDRSERSELVLIGQ